MYLNGPEVFGKFDETIMYIDGFLPQLYDEAACFNRLDEISDKNEINFRSKWYQLSLIYNFMVFVIS